MSTIKQGIKIEIGRSKHKFDVAIESYTSAEDVVNDLQKRSCRISNYRFDKSDIYKSWYGVDNYEEAMDLLKLGYQPTVDSLKGALKSQHKGDGKRISFANDVHGFCPVVPLALKGVPQSMMNSYMKPIKCKVIDVYYDMTVTCGYSSEQIIEAGQKLLRVIIDLEKQGYKFNLYAVQTYTNGRTVDCLSVKVKSSDKPIDLKRISFPLTHTAFFRVVGFEWQGKTPISRDYGSGRGHDLATREFNGRDDEQEFAHKVFGENAVYFAASRIVDNKEDYIKEALTVNEKPSGRK